MKAQRSWQSGPVYLGIEGGGTRTVALAVDGAGHVLRRIETGPTNLRFFNDAQLMRQLRQIGSQMPAPSSVAVGLAGTRTEADRIRIRAAAQAAWPKVPCYATNDLETGLIAAEPAAGAAARVLVLSGTGSCCHGDNGRGTAIRIGGWGHILGDKGSGYDIALRALKALIEHYDLGGTWPALGQKLLRAARLNEPEDLVEWVQGATKAEVAALAPLVFEAAEQGDKIAREILRTAAAILAKDGVACAKLLFGRGRAVPAPIPKFADKRGRAVPAPVARVQFVLAGGILLKQAWFTKLVGRELKKLWPQATITPLTRESVWGAVVLAKILAEQGEPNLGQWAAAPATDVAESVKPSADLQQLTASPTEQRNPRSMNLDRLPLDKAVRLMLTEEAKTAPAVLKELDNILRAIALVVQAFRGGGRLFYAGAGTSGRLGILDASECPPTFNTAPEMVQGIMAGGQRALWDSVEGAEDDAAGGRRAVQFGGVGQRDVVIGIAASGRTPFVWGALDEARQRGAKTVLLTFNPHLQMAKQRHPNVIIAPNVGPEVLTGSTRLKAGTATKLVLNAITTIAMVRLGKVRSNLMVEVKASNAKLQDRATRILQQLTGGDYAACRAALEKRQWKIRDAEKLVRHRGGR